MRRLVLLAIWAIVSVSAVVGASPAQADHCGSVVVIACTHDAGGTQIAVMSRTEMNGLVAEQSRLVAAGGPRWKYRTAMASCGVRGSGSGGICWAAAVQACASNTPAQGRGPLTDVFRMWVDADGLELPPPSGVPDAKGWVRVGATCLPELVPGVAPTPTVEMIVAAFHRTPWAKARVAIQPEGGVTVVNLKTFYRVDWSSTGFEPGEVDRVDPATMFGYRVEIRPKLVGLVYDFGDGVRSERTTSLGGVYPDGDVTHTYRRRGEFTTRVVVTFGADFRVNGGAWIEVPDTVSVTQPGTVITVKEARAVLVNQ